tara:strand:+ start:827 stop:1087 length:261 start_codon:yes stop_codon:yes gene_type:complete
MYYDVFTGEEPFQVSAVSPQDAALKVVTRLASQGYYIPHGKPFPVSVQPSEEVDFDYKRIPSTRVTVTPLGRTWGSIVNRAAEVAA